jgi:hypothetical protein
MFSGVVLVDGRPERSSSSVLEAFVPQKSFALAHSIISKCFLKHSVAFFELEAKFDADSLLLKICHFSWRKKSPDH